MKIGRNDPCHCGSGQKYKKCCLSKDDAARSAELAAQAAEAAAQAAAAREKEESEGDGKDKPANADRPGREVVRSHDTASRPKASADKAPPAIRRKAI